MFPQKFRLAKTKDVKAVFARGRTFFNPFVTVKFFSCPKFRFTAVVSTKVDKRAVGRNRLKRITREFFRAKMSQLPTGDYALILKPKAVQISEKELLAGLSQLLVKSRLLR